MTSHYEATQEDDMVCVTPEGNLSPEDLEVLANRVWELLITEIRIQKERSGVGYL